MKFIVALSLLLAVESAAPKRLVVPVKDAHVIQWENHALSAVLPPLVDNFRSKHSIFTQLIEYFTTYSHAVTLGTTSSNGDDPNVVVVHTTKYIVHENYDSYYLSNDVTLVDLVKNVKLTASVWISPVLRFVNLNTISNEDCADVYGGTIVDSTLCCRGNPEHSTCNGDSGGPLFEYDSKGKPHHIGVISFVSSSGCASGDPSGYAQTSYFIPWLKSHTGPL
ncbi:hypothetical protein FQA39_LY02947 [Lamprigera yunnana]|nr:hypothetical protein FQA39_LY02947 [Lamprigera yunnana]